MGRYTNLSAMKRTPVRKRAKMHGPLARPLNWFMGLSRKQKIMVIAAPILLFLILTPIITYLLLANDIKDPERLMNRNNTGIVLQDVNGKAFYSVGRAEHRNNVPLNQISQPMQHALIASEDKDFYKHGGFNLFSIIRALVTRTGGGSTLTQQLVKNTLLSDEHSYLRKYQELFMAIAVEQNYTKDQILEMYLNSVYFGENAFGVEDAAKAYFNTTADKLDVAQSAMLVGVLPAPSAYSPISGSAEYAKERQTTVLTRMVNNNYITNEEKTAALSEELAYGSGGTNDNTVAPHFAEMVINQLSKKYGYETVMRSGYQVKTTLDLSAQTSLQDSVNAGMKHVNAMNGSNAAGLVLDPTNGEVRALVGSADYNNEKWGKVNMVTTARQPGSSFKPIYYSYALADGVITPATVLDDKVIDFGGGYTPRDADRSETSRGQVTVRQALDWSLNIPSVHVMQSYTITKSMTAAKNLGITTLDDNKNYGLSLALGSAEVPLQQMTHAYAAFANQGQQYDMQLIQRIDNKFGKEIFKVEHSSKQVISKEGAYLTSNILSDNTTRSRIFGSSLTVRGHTVAVKTGTTNDNRDAWTIGYNPQYVVGVWVGNNDNTVMASGGSDMAGPIWRNTMTKLLSGKQNVAFTAPSSIVQKAVCTGTGGLAQKAGANTYNEYFMSGALPTANCNVQPTTISVCDTTTGKITTIDEDDFDSTTQSRDTSDCKAPTVSVCDTTTGQVVSIDRNDATNSQYSSDTTNCKKKNDPTTTSIQACDTTTGTVVTITESQLDGVRYTQSTTNCQALSTGGNGSNNASNGGNGNRP